MKEKTYNKLDSNSYQSQNRDHKLHILICSLCITFLIVFGISLGTNYALTLTQSYASAIMFVLAQPLCGLIWEGIIYYSSQKTQVLLRKVTRIIGAFGIICYLFGFIMGFVVMDETLHYEAMCFLGQCALEITGISILVNLIMGFINADSIAAANNLKERKIAYKEQHIWELEQDSIERSVSEYRYTLMEDKDLKIRNAMAQQMS